MNQLDRKLDVIWLIWFIWLLIIFDETELFFQV